MRSRDTIVLIAPHIVALISDDRDVMRRRVAEPQRQVARLLAEHATKEQLQGLLEDARSLDRWMATETQAGTPKVVLRT